MQKLKLHLDIYTLYQGAQLKPSLSFALAAPAHPERQQAMSPGMDQVFSTWPGGIQHIYGKMCGWKSATGIMFLTISTHDGTLG